MFRSKFILLCVALFVFFPLVASLPHVRNFTKININAGNQNWDIAQCENDWMYFANNNGLLEFDGLTWRLYPILNKAAVRSLYYDKKTKRIYAGGYNEFGYYYRKQDGMLHYRTMRQNMHSTKMNIADVWNIHKLSNHLIFQADYHIVLAGTNYFKVFKFNDKIYNSEIINDKLYIAQFQTGISYFNGHKFIEISDNELLKNKKVCAILPYQTDQMLFVTDLHGIYLYKNFKLSRFQTHIDHYLKTGEAFSASIRNNKLAIGTVQSGLIVKNLSDNSILHTSKSTGLQNNTVLCLSFDNSDNLWLGLDNGIDYIIANSPVQNVVGNSNHIGAGYTSALFNNKLYLGTNQGLYFQKYNYEKNPQTYPKNNIKGQIWSLSVINNEMFCAADKGLFVFNNENITAIDDLRGVFVVKQLNKNPNRLLGLKYYGFFVLDKKNNKWRLSNNIRGYNEGGKSFIEDTFGDIWVSHSVNGIFRLSLNENLTAFDHVESFDIKNGLPTNHNNNVFEFNNQIQVSTEKGFYTFNPDTKKFDKSVLFNKLFQGSGPFEIKINAKGDIWALSSNNIYVAHRYGNKYVVDSSSFLLLNNKMIRTFEHINTLPDGKVIFGTENGFSVFENSKATAVKKNSKLAIRSIYFIGQTDTLMHNNIPNDAHTNINTIESDYNTVRFEYVCTEFRNENAVKYSYKLENYDKKWSNFSNSTSKEYSKIPPGKYIFRVKAVNQTNAQTLEANYSFEMKPPWYLSTFAKIAFYLLFVLALLLLVVVIEKRVKRASRKMELLKEQEIIEQKNQFLIETKEKENEIIALKNLQLEYELKHKSQDLANTTMTILRKNEMLQEMNKYLDTIEEQLAQNLDSTKIKKQIQTIQKDISQNIETDSNWSKFQDNFDLVYDHFLKRLGNEYPNLSQNDKKICAYLHMNLTSKEIAPLVNTTYQSVEMTRHRLRKKLNLARDVNLTNFLQKF